MAGHNKVAIITGAGSGVGRSVAIAFLKDGYRTVLAGRRSDALEETIQLSGVDESRALAVPTDVTDKASVENLFAKTKAAFGRVDVLFNNAGVNAPGGVLLEDLSLEDWQKVVDTNLTGLFNMTHPVWSGMRDRKFGRIINISSINGQKGQAGQANYSAAKAGDLGFTKALAQEGARAGITVNAICPGYIATEMVKAIDEKVLNERIIPQIPVGRLGEPEEIARTVVFLASDDAGFITGSTISANGGQFFV